MKKLLNKIDMKQTVEEVAREAGAWMVNFNNAPILWLVPALGVVLPLLTILTSRMEKGAWAFVFSSLTLACIILTAGIAMFPFVMPSSTMSKIERSNFPGGRPLSTMVPPRRSVPIACSNAFGDTAVTSTPCAPPKLS